jgi:hypothetical protein
LAEEDEAILQRRRHRLVEHRRGGAGIDGAHRDYRRRDLGILGDRQHPHRRQARQRDEDRQDGREDRTIDEEA